MKPHLAVFLAFISLFSLATTFAETKPHAVFVIGTPHYNPASTMPPLAEQLERFGFTTTLVQSARNPENNPDGIPGLEAMKEADVAIFYLRFLTLPEDQLQLILDYLESGKPVVGFRTSTHAFNYPVDHPLAKWNDAFGKQSMGSKYFIHGGGSTQVTLATSHEVFTGYDATRPLEAKGTLYLSDLPEDAHVLLRGTGKFKKTGTVTNRFGTHELQKEMTDDVAWTWTNEWGGRVFGTTLGHPQTFADPNFVRLFINGIHWAAGIPVPPATAKVEPIHETELNTKYEAPKPEPAKEQVAMKALGDKVEDAKNKNTGKPAPERDPELEKYGIYEKTAPRPESTEPVETGLPLALEKGDRIAFIGNTLFDLMREQGHFEAMLHAAFPQHQLRVRNLAWSADALGIQPRPDNFADTEQHLFHEKADVIFAAFGFNESFSGPDGVAEFREELRAYLQDLKRKAFNGESGSRIVLVSPIPNENIPGVVNAAANNPNLKLYTQVMQQVSAEQNVGFANVFEALSGKKGLTFNGCHLNEAGYREFSQALFQQTFGKPAPQISEDLRDLVVDKSRQYFRRYRPLNSFYYTGGRNKSYGYLDFLPAMRNFDIMVANRERAIWSLAQGKAIEVDDSNLPPLPASAESRGANEWMTAADELKAFNVDPRFEVSLFAGEEEFPDIACPIQMRWDSHGRMWVSCSTTYPHVYPGNEPNDKLVILEDTDGDGKADKSTVFADDLHIPLSFELGDGGVYVSEEPHLTFIKDTDGDGKADLRQVISTGYGCEDSHHALHDFAWTPDGDLIFRESIFHHSQVETPRGPVRQMNSGWFRFEPAYQRLTSFGSYHSTNPWGVTFDKWGRHVASHPIFAAAFHALDPQYPEQHPKPAGLTAYSGTCGQEFVDFPSWPKELQGGYIKVRYKPTNRVEFLDWKRYEFGYDEEYKGDLIFSTNLSFIPVDVRFGPRGAMYVCDWYNPIKGHAQYSLRDPRRDRHSGRIWRIIPKDAELADPPKIAGASIPQLLENLKRQEYRYRYWTKRELRERDPKSVAAALDKWVADLDPQAPDYRHHQLEALWSYRGAQTQNLALLEELLNCDNVDARAAATQMLRFWHQDMDEPAYVLRDRANDPDALVRMEAAIAASYMGTEDALLAMLDTLKHPHGGHVSYAIRTSLGSRLLKPLWENNEKLNAAHPELKDFLASFDKSQRLKPSKTSAQDANFDSQKDLKKVTVKCIKERMLFDVTKIQVTPGQPIKLTLVNPDATQHNLVLVKPGALEEVGMAANEMAKDPNGMKKGFIPKSSKILEHSSLLDPESSEVMRFTAPKEPGVYPYLCTFPGHWVIMRGELIVADASKKPVVTAQKAPMAKPVTPKPAEPKPKAPESEPELPESTVTGPLEEAPTYAQPKPLKEAPAATSLPMKPKQGENLVFIGNSLAQRMEHSGHFEMLLHQSFPDKQITFRNMGFPGHTPAFRPEAGQPDPWAFPGAEKFRPEINDHLGIGHYPKPDEWLTILKADTIVAFFGFNESFDGLEGVDNFKAELSAFIDHTLSRSYNGTTAPRLVLATPIAMEQQPDYYLPDAAKRTQVLAAYAQAVKEVAQAKKVGVVDLFSHTRQWFSQGDKPLTINGVHLSDEGYAKLAPVLFEGLFGTASPSETVDTDLLLAAVKDKNWFWRNDYRMLNGVHVYGRRWKPFGNVNYPEEIEKIRQMTVLRDFNIWSIAQGKSTTLTVDDSKTRPLTPIETNYKPSEKNGSPDYLMEEEALKKFTLPEGYEVSVFATEQEFPLLQNPAQMMFDNKGRLWVSVVPSYPHYKPGGAMPNDKLLVYEDTDGDGRADKETVFAENLHIPIGFELAPEGVYISEEPFLTLHKDLDGDGKADTKEYLLDGFDPHDTHHAISAFNTDNGGGIFMCEGRFLHSQVETPWGPQRMTDGGAWRFDPKSWKVERVFQSDVSNPWGVAHDDYGQNYLNDASGGKQFWMLPLSMKVPHAHEITQVEKFNFEHHVRPTSGSEFLFSRHFPDEVQGDYLYCNTIGFLGIKQYHVFEADVAIKAQHHQDLIVSSDGNFRPVDLEMAPDGSLYFIDWHNALIGHMQHSARDPMRNSQYGRIYRITYPSRPLVTPPKVDGADLKTLFENFKLPELQARKRSHRELRARDADKVIAYAHQFAEANSADERLVLESLWTTWGHQRPSLALLEQCLSAEDHRVRCAAVRVIRHCIHLMDEPADYLRTAARDEHPRVRLEALAAATWLGGRDGAEILLTVASQPTDVWIRTSLNSAVLLLKEDAEALLTEGKMDRGAIQDVDLLLASKLPGQPKEKSMLTAGINVKGKDGKAFKKIYDQGAKLFERDGACATCHQPNGQGLANIYPPLIGNQWVNGDKERLIKLTLHGLWGDLELDGKLYSPTKGVPPMTPLGGMFNDEELAAVLTYVRHSWGNNSGVVTPEEVAKVRAATKGRVGFYSPEELLKEHPMPKEE